nr:hypothetical protein [uncultured Bacteroides sp.]
MSLQNKTKSNNYPGSQRVNVAVTWDEGYASYHGRSHGRVDVFFFRNTDNNCCEKSADDIVPDLNRLLGEGLNLI